MEKSTGGVGSIPSASNTLTAITSRVATAKLSSVKPCASGLITQACLDENISEEQLGLHSDNGKPMKGATMLSTLEKLGVIPSFSRPSVSDDNPYSESLFKTVKYHPSYPSASRFDSIAEARIWMEQFVTWYNTQHLHSGLNFVAPEQRHL